MHLTPSQQPVIDTPRSPNPLPWGLRGARKSSTPLASDAEAVARHARCDAPRVLHVVVAGERGGAERFLCDLASRPAETGATHAVAVMSPNRDLVAMLRSACLKVHDRGIVRENPIAFLWRSLGWQDVRWLSRIIQMERANIVHLHTFQSHVVGTRAACRMGTRILRTEHDIRHFVDPSCSPFTRWALQRSHAVAAVSRWVSRFIKRRAPDYPGRLLTIHNGVNSAHFAPPAVEPSGSFRFVVVSRLEPTKQVDFALRALRYVPKAMLDVVGDGSEMSALRRLSRRLGVDGRVTFHGHLNDTRPVVLAADVALSASRRESLGLSILEAQAMTKPVIAFAVGGIPEILNAETGWLVDHISVHALAARMNEVASDRSRIRRLGEAARAFVTQKHDVGTMCDEYRRLYRDVLRGA